MYESDRTEFNKIYEKFTGKHSNTLPHRPDRKYNDIIDIPAFTYSDLQKVDMNQRRELYKDVTGKMYNPRAEKMQEKLFTRAISQ